MKLNWKFDGKSIGLYPEILQAAREKGISLNDVFEFEIVDYAHAIITTLQHQRYTVIISWPIHVYAVDSTAIVLPDEEPRQLAQPKAREIRNVRLYEMSVNEGENQHAQSEFGAGYIIEEEQA